MRIIRLPSDKLIASACESVRHQRINHAVRLAHPDEKLGRTEVTALCGWRGVPVYVSRPERGFGVGPAGMYPDQKWCRKCRPIAKELRAEIDAPALADVATKRAVKGSSARPKPSTPGNSFSDSWPRAAQTWVRCTEFPTLTPSVVASNARINVEWRCPVRGHRNYVDQPANVNALLLKKKKPCPFCRAGLRPEAWTRERVLELVESIGPHIATLSAADRYILLLQTGILDSSGAWASAVADAMISSGNPRDLGVKLSVLAVGQIENDALLRHCLSAMRRLLNLGAWPESDRREVAKIAARGTLQGFHAALAFWAGSHDMAWREASIRTARLTDEDVVDLWRGAPNDSAGDELRRCLRAARSPDLALDQIEVIGLHTDAAILGAFDESRAPEDDDAAESADDLPTDSVHEILTASDQMLVADQDQEAIDYFVASQVSKLWSRAFDDPIEARSIADAWVGTGFGRLVRDTFLAEISAVETLTIPDDWRFVPDGSRSSTPVAPRVMQRLTAVRLLRTNTVGVGNWSLMGGGKTLSAVLSSAALGSRLTLILCPNATIEGWCAEIRRVFPEAVIGTAWSAPEPGRRRFIVLNVEQLQLADSPARVLGLLGAEVPDLIVLDEVHKFKQRDTALTRRRECLMFLLGRSAEMNPALRVLAMTGTPVINNLFEARSLIELCTLSHHQDLETKPTVANAMKVHARLARLGLRYRPDYMKEFGGVERFPVDVSDLRADIADAASRYEAELTLLRAKIPTIVAQSAPRTVVYCELVDKIHQEIAGALTAVGLRAGIFNGDDRSGLQLFKDGRVDCLIASSAIGTGIDGLQYSADRLVIATLPWTASDYDQLLGRFFRPKSDGQTGKVRVIVPWATIPDPSREGGEWSLDKARWNRSRYKATLADTAVDGVLPRGELRTPEQAFADLQQWLRRLNETAAQGGVMRPAFHVDPSSATVPIRPPSANALTAFHAKLARLPAQVTHATLGADNAEWRWYHGELDRVSRTWPFKPVDRCIEWIQRRTVRRGASLVVADLGCGLAPLRASLGSQCDVRSFDHVAIDDDIVVANIAERVPLDDESVDIAVLCLSADWQSDAAGCLREAARILAVDGQLLLWETPTFVERIGGVEGVIRLLEELGLTVVQTFKERFVGFVAGKF